MYGDQANIHVERGTEVDEIVPVIRLAKTYGLEPRIIAGPVSVTQVNDQTVAVIDFRGPSPIPELGRDSRIPYLRDLAGIRMFGITRSMTLHTPPQCMSKIRAGLAGLAATPEVVEGIQLLKSDACDQLKEFAGKTSILQRLVISTSQNYGVFDQLLRELERPLMSAIELVCENSNQFGMTDAKDRHQFETDLELCREALLAAQEWRLWIRRSLRCHG